MMQTQRYITLDILDDSNQAFNFISYDTNEKKKKPEKVKHCLITGCQYNVMIVS